LKVYEAILLILFLVVGWFGHVIYSRNHVNNAVATSVAPEVVAYIDKKFSADCRLDRAMVDDLQSKIAAFEKFRAERESLDNKREAFERAVANQQADREALMEKMRKEEFLKFRNEVTTMCAAPPAFRKKELAKGATPTPSPTSSPSPFPTPKPTSSPFPSFSNPPGGK
jgi:hypothetical protein